MCSQPQTHTISERGSVTGPGPSTSERPSARACPATLCSRRAFRSVWKRKSGPLFDFAAMLTLTLARSLNPRGARAEKIHLTHKRKGWNWNRTWSPAAPVCRFSLSWNQFPMDLPHSSSEGHICYQLSYFLASIVISFFPAHSSCLPTVLFLCWWLYTHTTHSVRLCG